MRASVEMVRGEVIDCGGKVATGLGGRTYFDCTFVNWVGTVEITEPTAFVNCRFTGDPYWRPHALEGGAA